MLAWMVTSSAAVVLILLVRRIFKGRISAKLQYSLWLLVLIRLLIPFNFIGTDVSILNLFSDRREAQNASSPFYLREDTDIDLMGTFTPELMQKPDTDAFSPVTAPAPAQSPEGVPESGHGKTGFSWRGLALRIWAAGVAVTGLVLLGVNLSFWRRLRRARCLQSMGVSPVPVYMVRNLTGPCLFGLARPAVYLPGDITKEQLPFVLAHEESHYLTGDHIWSLLRSLCLVLHWYHPLVWLAVYVSRQDSELACDERTVGRLGEESRRAYGRVLVEVTVQQSRKADFLCCATAMTSDGKSLKERIQMITKGPKTLAVTGVMVAVLMLGIFCVACTGVRGETDADNIPNGPQERGSVSQQLSSVSEQPEDGIEERPEGGADQTGYSIEEMPGLEGDGADPASDHVLSDNAYYRVIRDTVIDDPYFTMEVPRSLVGKVAYGVVLGQNQEGESYLRHLTLFHIDSLSGLLEGEPQYGWHELAMEGCLCYCFWTGYPDLEPELEQIAYRSGTWDIRGMEYLLAWDYDEFAGVGGSLIQANQAGTGAYFYMEPTSVEYDPQAPDAYMTCLEELRTCWGSFSAKKFPYEELEGYSTEEIPRWRQDFEEAERIYSWFTSMGEIPMKFPTGSDMGARAYEDENGMLYGVVDVPGIKDMEDLRTHVNRFFAPEITDALLAGRQPVLNDKGGVVPFVEQDGVLYGMAGGVGQYGYADAQRQYAVWFGEIAQDGQTGPLQSYMESGKRWRAYIHLKCRCSWSMWPGETLPQAEIFYVMEEQEDGSWRIIGRYELPISLTLEEAAQYGTYTAEADGRHYTLTLNRNKSFEFSDDYSSFRPDDENVYFYWEDGMLVLKYEDSDRVWYFQQEETGWNLTFRRDLSDIQEGDSLPDGTIFEKIS